MFFLRLGFQFGNWQCSKLSVTISFQASLIVMQDDFSTRSLYSRVIKVYFPQFGERAPLGFAVAWICRILRMSRRKAGLPEEVEGSCSFVPLPKSWEWIRYSRIWPSWELSNLLNSSSKAFLWVSSILESDSSVVISCYAANARDHCFETRNPRILTSFLGF